MTSIVDICNRALYSLGNRGDQGLISSLTEGSTQSNACATFYEPCFANLARSAFWNCLRNQKILTLIAAAANTPENPTATPPFPPTPWNYQYSLPSDCLQARYLVPSFPVSSSGVPISPAFISSPTRLPGRGKIPFQVAYATDSTGSPIQTILTNQRQAQLVYTVNQSNPQIWDSLFQEAMVQSLCAFLVPALNMNMALMQAAMQRATAMIAQARVRDGDEGYTSQDNVPDWIRARNGGASWGGYGEGQGAGYFDMCWPG